MFELTSPGAELNGAGGNSHEIHHTGRKMSEGRCVMVPSQDGATYEDAAPAAARYPISAVVRVRASLVELPRLT